MINLYQPSDRALQVSLSPQKKRRKETKREEKTNTLQFLQKLST